MNTNLHGLSRFPAWLVAVVMLAAVSARAASLMGSFDPIPQGSNVDLTAAGPVDWVHWGLYTETSLDRKAGVAPAISDFTVLDATNGYAYVYQFSDNYNGYSWSDGTPTAAVSNTTTGVWAYGVPTMGSGFQFSVPADTTQRTLKVYVGAFAARGKLEALLSDASAPAFTNTNFINRMGNGDSGVFSISYAAGSVAQTLAINWTLSQGFAADANVTLQAAALSVPGANSPPTVSIASPADNAGVPAGSDIAITVNAADSDGSVALVEFFANGNAIGQSASAPFNFTWSNVPAGDYLLTAKATDNSGATALSRPAEIFVNGTGGALVGATNFPPAGVDLTAEGTSDWAHWGLSSSNSFDHKAGVAQQIGNFTPIGNGSVVQFSDNYTAYDWSDGTPTVSAAASKTGVFVHGLTNGFMLTAPADSVARTLKLYVGLYGARGNFQAYLSDFSAPAYTDTSLSSVYGDDYGVYSLNYRAASPAQMLVVKYTARTLFDADYGNVTLQAATLSGGGSPTNSPPAVTLLEPAVSGSNFSFSFATRTGASYTVQLTDSLNPMAWNLATNFTGNGAVITVTNSAAFAQRFYRVLLQ